MLHASTTVLTPSGFVPLSTLKINDTLKTYFGTSRINKIEQDTVDLLKVSSGGTQIMCSTDQKFLLKSDSGYVFGIPKSGSKLVKYAVNTPSQDMLMTLQEVQDVTFWGKSILYRLHLDDDFLLIVSDYLVVRA